MGRGKTNKRKGSDAERYFANLFREIGFDKCITARLGGRIYDNAGIDLINIPLNIQIKGGLQRGLIPGLVLQNMREQIEKLFPKDSEVRTFPLIIIHRPGIYKKSCDEDKVYLSFEEFERLKTKFPEIPNLIDEVIESSSKKLQGEFKKIVFMPFKQFKDYVLRSFLNKENN